MDERLTVLGSGLMGHSITLTAAWAGMEVSMWGVDPTDLQRGLRGIEEKLDILHENGLIQASDIPQIKDRIRTVPTIEEAVAEATFVIEVIPENLALKQEFFQKLDRMCDERVVLASNTSGLSPTAIAKLTAKPERTVVTHFWNPAHLIPLVEVVRGEQTADDTVARSLELLRRMNKKPIEVKKDVLGSVGNRLQYALFREAQYILEQGIASKEDIDAAVTYSIGRRLPITGPFMTADMGGLDVFDSISNYLFADLCNMEKSLATMARLVEEGKYGQKTGEGFYKWDESFSKEMNQKREKELIRFLKQDWEIDT